MAVEAVKISRSAEQLFVCLAGNSSSSSFDLQQAYLAAAAVGRERARTYAALVLFLCCRQCVPIGTDATWTSSSRVLVVTRASG